MPSPSIGIVIPVYGHPRLVAEAINSVATQRFDGRITTVVVIDGDPHRQVIDVVNAMRPSMPIHAVYRRNGRLPAARNTGIEFLLKLEPELDAVYFLDADNRLSPTSISRFWSVLSAHPEAGWAYPDIGFFGLTWSQSGVDPRQTAPRYSIFRHLMGNICEAGSMVRGDLLRDGLRFDEAFNVGYEDWDFWLQCLDAGHIGTPVTNSGFHYRRRTDSMLAEADRRSEEIKAKMRAKHARLFSPQSITNAFLAECSPFLLLTPDGGMRLLAADGRINGEGYAAVEALFAAGRANFHFAYMPRFVVVPLGEANEPVAPNLAAGLQLLGSGGSQRTIDAAFAEVPPTDPAARAWLIPLDDIVLRRTIPQAIAERVAALDPLLRLLAMPSESQDGRYAGPAGYKVDNFIADFGQKATVVPASEPGPASAPLKGVHAIDPLGRWASNWLTAHHRFPRPGPPVSGLAVQPNLTYMGQTFPFEPPTPGGEPAAATAAASVLVEEWRLLPFCRFFFGASGTKLYYVCSEEPGDAELASIQCSEHALAGIFCLDAHRPLVEALSVPTHKLLSGDQLKMVLR